VAIIGIHVEAPILWRIAVDEREIRPAAAWGAASLGPLDFPDAAALPYQPNVLRVLRR